MSVRQVRDRMLHAEDMEPVENLSGGEDSVSLMDECSTRCICMKSRQVGKVELLCGGCGRWFHSECVSCYIGKVVPFMTNYVFYCKQCNTTGVESFTKKQPNFSQMCHTALANLEHQHVEEGTGKFMFSKEKEIIPYIDKWWDCLTTAPRRVTLTWHTTIVKTMAKETETFVCEEAPPASSDTDYPLFGLKDRDLSKVGPNYDAFLPRMQQGGGGAGACRRRTTVAEGVAVATTRKTRSEPAAKLPAHGYPTEHPFNKDGYRYILADADPHAPNRQEFDDSQECAGRPIPSYFYRGAVLPRVILAPNDRAAQLKLSDDRMTVTGEKGYCLIRASHCVRSGGWYYEFTVDDMPPETACRVGWAQAYENLQAPCGYDKFSYSWRSRKGTRFHNSRGRHYSAAYGEGDVLGCYIYLPELRDPSALVPDTVKDKPLVKFKNYLYYEDQLETQQVLKSLRPARGSRVVFYKNGRCQGTAFVDVHAGCYYPAVSLYRGCTVTVNFGPSFRCPPRDGVRYRPVSECATETIAQQTLSDLLFFVENEGKLTLEL